LSAAGRARTTAWVIAALNSIEPFVVSSIFFADGRFQIEPLLKAQLGSLSAWLDGQEYLEGRFTAGDLMMSSVLRQLASADGLARFPVLDAYRRRCEARPAFGRALEAQLQVYRDNQPAAADD
jgi:glutathione S-transferase